MKQGGVLLWAPAFSWLRSYEGNWLRGDVVAGITLAAYLLPAALGTRRSRICRLNLKKKRSNS